MRKLTVLILTVLVLFSAASLWAGGDKEAASKPVTAATGVYPAPPAGWTEADATESFTYQVSSALPILHPWDGGGNDTTGVVAYLIFDPLVRVDEEGNYVPSLATSWEFSADYSQIKLNLRDNVYFQSGNKFSADDVVYRFEDIRDNPNYPASSVRGWRQYLGEIEKVDDLTVIIHFAQPMPRFWMLATQARLMIADSKLWKEMGHDAFWQKPVGTGPYVVDKYDKANSIVKVALRTDEHGYWGYDDGKRWTNVKNITIQYSPEGQTRLAALRAGEVQMVDTIPTTDKAILEGEGFTVQTMNPNNVVFLQTASAPGDIFDNQKLREALSLSLDRELIVDALLSGFGKAANWPSRPGDYGYVDKQGYTFDPERAKQLVKESGYKGEAIDFIYTSSTVNIGGELTQAIQSMAADVGINLKIKPLEVAMYDDARANHDYDLALGAISDDGTMWWKLCAEVIGNDRFNTGFQNAELKALGKQAQTIIDPAKADAVFTEMYNIEMVDYAPNIYLYWPTIINAWDAGVTGMQYHKEQFPDLGGIVLQ